MAHAPNELLTGLLKDVSRSFYLTLRVLPKSIRPQIGLAYLLARTTDTIADTELIPLDQRLKSLQSLRERILGTSTAPLNFGELARQQTLPAERVLLEKCEASLELLQTLSESDRKLVREVIDVITSGQELDLRRFGRWGETTGEPASIFAARGDARPTNQIIALRTDEELDDYIYRVAGCVGEFWTKMCRAHVFPNAKLDDAKLLLDGVRFGKGLQLVNILRDLPADLKNGRCYLPGEKLAEIGFQPADLRNPANEPRLRPLYNRWLDHAEAHLAAGWNYTNTVPRTCVRVRLACAWPVLIGLRTIERLRTGNVLDPQQRIKISRAQVRKVILQSVVCYPLQGVWRNLARSRNPV
jgi:farnesyl-diphosphate farnesyltransferase